MIYLFLHNRNIYSIVYTWMILHLISIILPTLYGLYLALEVFSLFLPICGRFGIETNPEFVIGLFAWISTIVILSFIVCLKILIYTVVHLLLHL